MLRILSFYFNSLFLFAIFHLMNKILKKETLNKTFSKALFATFVVTGLFFHVAKAETASGTPPITSKEVSQVEVSIPVSKDDFLLFYGLSKEEDTNKKLEKLRSDFVTKFKALKDDYKASFSEIVKDKELSPIEIAEPVNNEEKSVSKDTVKAIKSTISTQAPIVKKYILNEKSKIEAVVVPPITNLINDKVEKLPETNNWFQKIKSFFGW